MHTARLAAEGEKGANFYGIVMVDDGEVAGDLNNASNPEHPAYFVAEIRQSLHYQGSVKMIRRENLTPFRVAAHT
jgi:hypothetical protein